MQLLSYQELAMVAGHIFSSQRCDCKNLANRFTLCVVLVKGRIAELLVTEQSSIPFNTP